MSINSRATLHQVADQDGAEPGYRSTVSLRMLQQVERYAPFPTIRILIEGESGTGKTWVARRIHDRSPRAAGPYRWVSLSGLDDGLANSRLYGHIAGAFTDGRVSRAGAFVCASGGTLVLDEIGKASLHVQEKLLVAVETLMIEPIGTDQAVRVDTRIVAVSNVRLAELVERGQFLDDLYARLEAFRIWVPPLRERRADIPILVRKIVKRRAAEFGYARAPEVDDALMRVLQAARWPHNIRELDGTIQRMLVDSLGAVRLTMDHCPVELSDVRSRRGRGAGLRRSEVLHALGMCKQNMSAAARLLGVDRKTLYRLLRNPHAQD